MFEATNLSYNLNKKSPNFMCKLPADKVTKVSLKAMDEKSYDAIGPSVGYMKNYPGLFRDLA